VSPAFLELNGGSRTDSHYRSSSTDPCGGLQGWRQWPVEHLIIESTLDFAFQIHAMFRLFKVFVRKARICSGCFPECSWDPAEHDRDRSAGRGITNHVKMLPGSGGFSESTVFMSCRRIISERDRAPHHRQGKAGRNHFRQVVDVWLISNQRA